MSYSYYSETRLWHSRLEDLLLIDPGRPGASVSFCLEWVIGTAETDRLGAVQHPAILSYHWTLEGEGPDKLIRTLCSGGQTLFSWPLWSKPSLSSSFLISVRGSTILPEHPAFKPQSHPLFSSFPSPAIVNWLLSLTDSGSATYHFSAHTQLQL